MIMVLGPHKKKADAKVDHEGREGVQGGRAGRRRGRGARRAHAAHAAGPVAQKKERGRSENLDPEIEA